MKNYIYQNKLIGKKQLRQLLAWSFTNYDSMQACALADELKYLGFKYASRAGISISIEDLRIPFTKNLMLKKAHQEILNAEKIYLKGKITDVERFQKIIDTWSLTSESLKEQVIYYFKNYDPLNSVYIMAFSGARGNLSQVRQLVGMRGLMSDPSGEIMKLPIKKNFREGLTITDYLMSGYGARKGIVDTALKTANSGYLTRRLIDVGQDILIREKDCLTTHSFILSVRKANSNNLDLIYKKIIGHVISKPIIDLKTNKVIVKANAQMTPILMKKCKENNIKEFYIRSALTCNLYRAVCQKCYGWDLANENFIDIGEAIGILAGQSIGEPGTQLTMRTFHTGGIFTSGIRQQIISPSNGIIQFYKTLKTVVLRTNRGEDVLLTKNSGFIILIPEEKTQNLIEIEVLRNTILFPKNNQYIFKNTVIGELINKNKQIKTEIKPILSYSCGEIFMPSLKNNINLLNNNKLIWILAGQLYNSPNSSFINFYPDYKLNSTSYIFRTKIINHYNGYVKFISDNSDLYQRSIRLLNNKYLLFKSNLQKLTSSISFKNYLLTFQDFKYLLKIKVKNSKFYLQLTRNNQFGILLTHSFKTLTGGIPYYDNKNIVNCNKKNNIIKYVNKIAILNKYKPITLFRTIIWLGEETYKINCESNILLVENGDFIAKGFELLPGLFSKISGIVNIQQKNNFIKTISIKSGLVYEGKQFINNSKKLYYPGEILISNVFINKLSFCEYIICKGNEQLLIRPVELYEFAYFDSSMIKKKIHSNSNIKFESRLIYSYKSCQKIKGTQNLNLISNTLGFELTPFFNKNSCIELLNNKKLNFVNINLNEKYYLNNHLSPDLRYKNIQSSFLVQQNQFVDQYTILGYLESLTLIPLEIVKFKIKIKDKKSKKILLISNDDCLIIKKNKLTSNKVQDFILNSNNVDEIGRIIIENKTFFTLQKGRPYFFPNCKNDSLANKTNLQYKTISPGRFYSKINKKRLLSLNYYNLLKLSLQNIIKFRRLKNSKIKLKAKFSKLFLKKNGKLYSSLIPQFLKKFSVYNLGENLNYQAFIKSRNDAQQKLNTEKKKIRKVSKTILLKIQNSKFIKSNHLNYQLALVKFLEYPFRKSNKSIGLYSITENYFEQEVNSIFCRNNEFIESGDTIGLLHLEKEITGDIVQGLPRIEEILEARKKNSLVKRIPISKKKGLLVQKTSLDQNFEFRKLGTSIKENDKINPHKLLKVYFNYYGLIKYFICDQKQEIKYSRLINNYEGSYKSFKKVQSFILNSVQFVYQSQGVSINDKHLEVIIKQMTTKVLITYEGNTPLLRCEIIDLYHIQYINNIVKLKNKNPAYYVPLLIGITKAALNNPSFISAASFQETTKVLTKAAIEGRIDWLRGLKENIIIGHLIPAGTGSQNYRKCFKKFNKLL